MNFEKTSVSAKPFLGKNRKWPVLHFVDCYCLFPAAQTESLWDLCIAGLDSDRTYRGLLVLPSIWKSALRCLRNLEVKYERVLDLRPLQKRIKKQRYDASIRLGEKY